MTPPECDWPEHKLLFLEMRETAKEHRNDFKNFLDEYRADRKAYNERMTKMQLAELELRIKSGGWGVIGGALTTAITLGILWLENKFKGQ